MTALQQELLSGTWQADPVHSSVQFAVRHMGVSTFRASYDDVDALLVRDDSGRRLEGVARVESVSITNPPGFREHVVRGKDFFDADRHPEITFRSAEVLIGKDGASSWKVISLSRASRAASPRPARSRLPSPPSTTRRFRRAEERARLGVTALPGQRPAGEAGRGDRSEYQPLEGLPSPVSATALPRA